MAHAFQQQAPWIDADDEVDRLLGERLFDDAERFAASLPPALGALQGARIGLKTDDTAAAIRWARVGVARARQAHDRLVEGRCLFIRAEALRESGRIELAGEFYSSSVDILRSANGGEFTACAEHGLGWFLIASNREAEAAGLFESAVRRAREANAIGRALTFGVSDVYRIYAQGRYLDALRKAHEQFEAGGEFEDVRMHTLRLKVLCSLALGHNPGSFEAAVEYSNAPSKGARWDRLASKILLARAGAVAGKPRALRMAEWLIRLADSFESSHYSGLARLWIWAGLRANDPEQACRRREEMVGPAERDTHPVAAMELRAVAASVLPTVDRLPLDAALSASRARVFLMAYERAKGSTHQMARLLGRTQALVSQEMKRLELPAKGKSGRPKKAV